MRRRPGKGEVETPAAAIVRATWARLMDRDTQPQRYTLGVEVPNNV